MKPIITITDYTAIKSAIINLPPHLKTIEIGELMHELSNAWVVSDEEIGDDVIQINSCFEIEEVNSKRFMKFTLTLPAHADLGRKKISILSPLGIALIGFKQGMVIDWVLPGGPKKIRILKVESLSDK